ncbi:hypothetical protein QJS10_CPB22g00064 [Acorus calamus]|uniref:Uncharacterized protein n=1 Tax=Acorus calamus TaxID=4465 RepID=A0AAV9BZ55_ACOCL|nr:hypothetical protein QJS10_CPB22g00064 [Acorus calamus]
MEAAFLQTSALVSSSTSTSISSERLRFASFKPSPERKASVLVVRSDGAKIQRPRAPKLFTNAVANG